MFPLRSAQTFFFFFFSVLRSPAHLLPGDLLRHAVTVLYPRRGGLMWISILLSGGLGSVCETDMSIQEVHVKISNQRNSQQDHEWMCSLFHASEARLNKMNACVSHRGDRNWHASDVWLRIIRSEAAKAFGSVQSFRGHDIGWRVPPRGRLTGGRLISTALNWRKCKDQQQRTESAHSPSRVALVYSKLFKNYYYCFEFFFFCLVSFFFSLKTGPLRRRETASYY